MADRSVVVRLIADTGQYNQGMRGAAAATNELNQSGQRSLITLGQLGKMAGGFVVASVVKAGVSFESLKQTSTAAFTTMLGSASGARGELSKLYDFALKTPFSYPLILQASQQLTAYGTAANNLIPVLRTIGDATAAMGGSADIFQRVVTAVGQIQAKGTVQAEEFRQLAEAGIPAWQFLASYLGTTIPEAMKQVENRTVSATQGIAALEQGVQQRFGGAMDAMGNTWQRSVDRFVSSARRMGADVMAPIMTKAQQTMAGLTTVMNQAGPVLGQTLGMVASLLTPLGALLSLLGQLPGAATQTALALGVVYLASGRLNAIIPALRAGWGSFGDQMRLQQQLANMSGASLSRLGAAATVAGMRVRAAGAQMLSAFGGPIGLAIVGITTALGIYAQRQSDAAARVQAHKAAVDELTTSLEKNTLTLNQNAADTELNSLTYGSDESGKPFKALDYLNSVPGAAQVARQAIQGNADALARLKVMLADKDGELRYGGLQSFNAIAKAADNLRESIKTAADETRLKLPDAASAAGVSMNTLTTAFNAWVAAAEQGKREDFAAVLQQYGVSADQAAKITQVLGATAANASGGFDTMASAAVDAAVKARQAIAQAAASFVSPTGAWDAVVSRKQAAMKAASGGSTKKPKLSDDAAVKSADAAVRAYDRQRKAMNDLASKAAKAAKSFADGEKKKADAAKKAADAIAKAASDGQEALSKAQDRKSRADRDAQDAAAILAAVQQAQLRAGTEDTLAWASAVQKAQEADRIAKAEQIAATDALTKVQAKAIPTEKQVAAAKAASEKAADRATKAQDRATAASEHAQAVQESTQAKYQQLLDAKNAAEDRARASTEDMASGGAGAVSDMVDDVKVSLAEYLTELRKQVKAQTDWKNNLLTLASKIPPGVLSQLAQLGPAAAPLVQALVDGTRQQTDEFAQLFPRSTEQGVQGMTDELVTGLNLVAQIAKIGGANVAAKYSQAIRDGRITVQQAMTALKGTVDKDTLEVKLKANANDVNRALANLTKTPVVLPLQFKFNQAQVDKLNRLGAKLDAQVGEKHASGGWVRGGTGRQDDVRIGPGIWAMAGEYVVKKSLAQANKPFFDYIDRYGRMPPAVAAPPMVNVSLPASVPSGPQVVNHITVYQQPGQSAAGLAAEIDRRAPLAGAR